MSAVFSTNPFARQLNLIRLALPSAKRIGILLGADPHPHFYELNVAAMGSATADSGPAGREGQDIAWTLQRLLPDIDLLLALPEPTVFNAGAIQMILLSAYRQQNPHGRLLGRLHPGPAQSSPFTPLRSRSPIRLLICCALPCLAAACPRPSRRVNTRSRPTRMLRARLV
ncbi:MAG: hypothetical protein M5R42_00490 [Rhodocyclaceae bacterium]|nr:hypothetical protein [Rhodocyclaceae bacterium]